MKRLRRAEAVVEAGVDILEAGTPLIVAQGAGAIGRLARDFPQMPILRLQDDGLRDSKNVQITQREGGHYMTVCANAAMKR
jgi:3-keto-L-gulonate-6-phosphate decarboxylase